MRRLSPAARPSEGNAAENFSPIIAATSSCRRCEFFSSARRTRLCEKSVVQFACRTSVPVSSIRKPITLATSVGRRQLRKQFCASLAHATFHTAWNAGTHNLPHLLIAEGVCHTAKTRVLGVWILARASLGRDDAEIGGTPYQAHTRLTS